MGYDQAAERSAVHDNNEAGTADKGLPAVRLGRRLGQRMHLRDHGKSGEGDERLGEFLALPLKHRRIICEPCLSKIDFHGKLDGRISGITAGGESGPNARICDFEWILYLREQCERAGIGFHFKQTGAKFLKDGHLYRIARKNQHSQARRAGINIDK